MNRFKAVFAMNDSFFYKQNHEQIQNGFELLISIQPTAVNCLSAMAELCGGTRVVCSLQSTGHGQDFMLQEIGPLHWIIDNSNNNRSVLVCLIFSTWLKKWCSALKKLLAQNIYLCLMASVHLVWAVMGCISLWSRNMKITQRQRQTSGRAEGKDCSITVYCLC